MRLDDQRESENFRDDRGQGGGGGGFGLGGLPIPLGRGGLGLGGLAVIVVISLIAGVNPLSLLGGGSGYVNEDPAAQQRAAPTPQEQATDTFVRKVLGSTEDTWGRIFQQSGQTYRPATLAVYSGVDGRSGCGTAQSAMGPFYCPTDQTVYLDEDFFNELKTRFGGGGDFAEAYVIAHEIGHHVQDELGTLGKATAAQQRAGTADANAIQVRVELQADCYAGVWGAANKALLDEGDLQEALRAAQAIGDDTLQKQSTGRVVPDSFTHGTSAERMRWLKRGYDSGDPAQCDTFKASEL